MQVDYLGSHSCSLCNQNNLVLSMQLQCEHHDAYTCILNSNYWWTRLTISQMYSLYKKIYCKNKFYILHHCCSTGCLSVSHQGLVSKDDVFTLCHFMSVWQRREESIHYSQRRIWCWKDGFGKVRYAFLRHGGRLCERHQCGGESACVQSNHGSKRMFILLVHLLQR